MGSATFLLGDRAQAWCDLRGRSRFMSCRGRGAASAVPLANEATQLRRDATGVGAEQVVRFYFGAPAFADGDPAEAWDLVAYGMRIDVKATEWRHGKLQCHANSRSKADAYVLVVRTGHSYDIAGWVPAEELKTDGNWERHFPNAWTVPQDELRRIEDLGEWAQARGYLELGHQQPGQGGAFGAA